MPTYPIKFHGRDGILTCIATVAGLFLWTYVFGTTDEIVGDQYFYYLQSGNPASVVMPPYCLRILLPRLVYLLPFDPGASFWIVNNLCIAAFVTTLYLLFKRLQVPAAVFLTLLVVVAFDRRFHDLAFYPYYADSLSLFLITLCFYFTERGNGKAFSFCFALSVLSHEIAWFAAPVYLFARWNGKKAAQPLLCAGALILPGLCVFVLTRFVMLAVSDHGAVQAILYNLYGIESSTGNYIGFYLREFFTLARWKTLIDTNPLHVLTFGFGFLFPFSAAGAVYGNRLCKGLLSYLVLIFISLLFALMSERILFFSLPAVMLLAGVFLKEALPCGRVAATAALSLFFLLALLFPDNAWLGLAACAGTALLIRTKRDPRGSTLPGEPAPADCSPDAPLKTGFNTANLLLILLVCANVYLVYYCAPSYLFKLNDFTSGMERSGRDLLNQPPVYGVGDYRFVPFTLPRGKEIRALATDVSTSGAVVHIPLRHTPVSDSRCLYMVVVAYPVAESSIEIGMLNATGQPGQEKKQEKFHTLSFGGRRLEMLRISIPILLPLDSGLDQTVYLSIKPGVLLVDALFLDATDLDRFQRRTVFTIGSDRLESF